MRLNINTTFILPMILLSVLTSCSSIGRNQKRHIDPIREFTLDENLTKQFEESDVAPVGTINEEKIIESKPLPEKDKRQQNIKNTQVKNQPIQNTEIKKPKEIVPEFISWDKKSLLAWNRHSQSYLKEGEIATYSISLYGLDVGQMVMSIEPAKYIGAEYCFHFHAHIESNGYLSYIYELSDSFESFVQKKNFTPLKTHVNRVEKIQSISELSLYDLERRELSYWMKREMDGKTFRKSMQISIPNYFNDYISSFFFLRTLQLQVGEKFFYPIINKSKIWIFDGRAVKVETINDFEVIKIEGKLKLIDKKRQDVTPEPMTFWISNQPPFQIVKFQIKLNAGRITGHLEDFVASEQ